MRVRKANAVWEGTLRGGAGRLRLGSSRWEGPYSFASRFESAEGTNPEELIGAALAGCFSMALTAELTRMKFKPEIIRTDAEVDLGDTGDGPAINVIRLITTAVVPGLGDADFESAAQKAKAECPVSRALAGVEIKLNAALARKARRFPDSVK